jgi:hypothetical protein
MQYDCTCIPAQITIVCFDCFTSNLKQNNKSYHKYNVLCVLSFIIYFILRLSWSMFGSWIYNYLFNQCLSPLTLWVWSHSDEVYTIQHYVIKFVSDLRQVGSFLWLLYDSSTNNTDLHDITEILLKVALSTITLNLYFIHVLPRGHQWPCGGGHWILITRLISCEFSPLMPTLRFLDAYQRVEFYSSVCYNYHYTTYEWVSDWCLMQNEQFLSYIMVSSF